MIKKFFGIFFAIFFIFFLSIYYILFKPNSLKEPIEFEIKKGEYPLKILKKLKDEKIIFSDKMVYFYLIISKSDKKIKAGEYLIEPKLNTIDLIKKFTRGEILKIPITLKEGWTIFDYAKEFSEKNVCTYEEFIEETKKTPQWLKAKNMEGFLYPDTYYFSKNSEPKEIINKLHKNFLNKIKDLRDKIENSNFSIYEIITLASIVEKEAKLEKEKPKIAGVFLNRLEKKMRLEADPTVIYSMNLAGLKVKNLKKDDLKFSSNYNTYLNYGLPPGPICNPSLSSIKAVLYPEKSNYYYFVAKGDGSHYFSTNLKEHIRAIQIYR